MSFDLARHNMVLHQLERRGIHDPRVLEAMEWVPREEFVPPELVDLAYDDRALPIGLEQTISQPYTVAFMCQEALLTANDKVLEIGTGSGYGAAVLSLLTREVHTIERIEELFHAARDRLARLGYDNVRVYLDDGTQGLPSDAPFDAIICTAGAEVLPEAYGQQLTDGGRLVIPIGPPAHQQMIRLTRRGDTWDRDNLGSFGFVPLVGDAG
ncbi:MAG TPA: protein-L-isoaspartate(D-aspartate) O-methyltransferase [Lacipirellulaceae bacterium]|nr:protein-L-isoaspartate(D-aspartate) O-methyltransferase [Lacipirellulaceae bacterium]HJS07853.1 protein-L-isoaspartate(D-aspartate) O-methyltransferase [Pirellulales bacterium]